MRTAAKLIFYRSPLTPTSAGPYPRMSGRAGVLTGKNGPPDGNAPITRRRPGTAMGDPAVLQRHIKRTALEDWRRAQAAQTEQGRDLLAVAELRSHQSGWECACSWTRSSCDCAFAAARRRCSPPCRFSAGRDPGFSKPFPPDLSTRLSARRAPLACLTHRDFCLHFRLVDWSVERLQALGGGRRSVGGGPVAAAERPRRGASCPARIIASAPSRPDRAGA